MQAELSATEDSAPLWRVGLSRVAPAALLASSRCSGVALQFLLQIVVGGMAGPAGIGILQLFSSWSSILGEALARGLPPWAMRIVSVDGICDQQRARAGNGLRWAIHRVVKISLLFALVAWPVLLFLGEWLRADYYLIVQAVILAAPLIALLRLGSEALKGNGRALLAVSIENFALPLIVLLICLSCWLLGQRLYTPVLVCAGICGIAMGLWVVWRVMPASWQPPVSLCPVPAIASDDSVDVNFLWASSLLAIILLQLPFLLLPWFAPPEEIGVYAIAHKLLNIVTTLLILLSAVFGPAFARAGASEGTQGLRRLLRRTQWVSRGIFIPLCMLLLLAVQPLAELFSVPGDQLRLYMLILAGGQLVNASTGLAGVLLNMTGGARLEMLTLISALVFAVLTAPVVGAAHGALGIAAVFSVAMAAKNLASYLAVSYFLSREEYMP